MRGARARAQKAPVLHLLKLAVGAKDPDALARLQAARFGARPRRHLTRLAPRRAGEVLAGGSLYWVVAGAVRARQAVLGIEPARRADGRPAAALVLAPALVPVRPRIVKPFQGWRYLEAAEAPPDLPAGVPEAEGLEALPPALRRDLAALGLL